MSPLGLLLHMEKGVLLGPDGGGVDGRNPRKRVSHLHRAGEAGRDKHQLLPESFFSEAGEAAVMGRAPLSQAPPTSRLCCHFPAG